MAEDRRGNDAVVTVSKLGGGEVARFEIGSVESVAKLKQYLEEEQGHPHECQRLLLGSELLRDDCSLADLEGHSTLALTMILDAEKLWVSFCRAVKEEKVRTISTLLDTAPTETLREMLVYKKYLRTPLLVVVKAGSMEACRSVLGKACELGVDMRTVLLAAGDYGMTCAHTAAYNGDTEICRLIWDAAAKQGLLPELLQLQNNAGWTPCHLAASHGSQELFQLIPEYVPEADHLSVLFACTTRKGYMPVHCAAMHGHFAVCEEILSMACPKDRGKMLAKDVDGRTLHDLLKDEGYEHCSPPVCDSEQPSTSTLGDTAPSKLFPGPSMGRAATALLLVFVARALLAVWSLLARLLEKAATDCARVAARILRALARQQPEEQIRYACLIGQERYQAPWEELQGAWQDVDKLDRVLRDCCGFQVTVMPNATQSLLKGLGPLLAQNLRGCAGGTLLLYYSGHAISGHKDTYLVPTDVNSVDLNQCASLNAILQTADEYIGGWGKASAKVSTILVVVDACHRLPSVVSATSNGMREHVRMPPSNTQVFMLNACEYKKLAYDAGAHGLLSKVFIEALQIPGVTWLDICEKCSPERCDKRAEHAGKRQRPWMNTTNAQAPASVVLHDRRVLLYDPPL